MHTPCCLAVQVATVDELSNVKQAMADLSKQHFLDVKRLRDAAGPAAAGLAPPQSSPESAPGIRRMVDTHPPRAHGRGPRTSESSDGLGGVENDRRDDQPGKGAAAAAAAASPGAAGEDALSPVPVYKLQIQIRQLERQLADQAAKTQEEVTKREAVVSCSAHVLPCCVWPTAQQFITPVPLQLVAVTAPKVYQFVRPTGSETFLGRQQEFVSDYSCSNGDKCVVALRCIAGVPHWRCRGCLGMLTLLG